jgi:hypothetical protein
MTASALVLAGDSVALAYGVAFGFSAFTQVFNPAANATLPDVVAADELVDANAVRWTVAVVAQIILAPLAGALIVIYGVGPAFAVNAASYLASAALLIALPAGRSLMAVPTRGGRAFALYDVVRDAARLISLGLGGVLADKVGIQAVNILGGSLLLTAFLVGWTAPTSARPSVP